MLFDSNKAPNEKQVGIITGAILADGHIKRRKSESGPEKRTGARFQITMKTSSKGYLLSFYEQAFSYLGPTRLVPYPNPSIPRHEGKEITQFSLTTRTTDFLYDMHILWYKWDPVLEKWIKIVPADVGKVFTKESLAHWIIQDGYFDNHGRTQTIILCTESFTKEECIMLQDVLTDFGIKSSLKVRNKAKNTYRIRISKQSMDKVRSLVTADIPSEFRYKLGTGK